MRTINYILVNETDSKTAARAIGNCKLPDIGHHIVVVADDGFKVQGARVQGGEPSALILELCQLRKRHPDAKILGISELGDHCVHPTERMNQVRRAMSDLP